MAKNQLIDIFPFLSSLGSVARLLCDKNYKDYYDKEANALRNLRHQIGNNFKNYALNPTSGIVLIFGFSDVQTSLVERVIGTAFELAGMKPVVMGSRSPLSRKTYNLLGFQDLHTSPTIISTKARRIASDVMKNTSSEKELFEFTYNQVPCGKYVLATLMRSTRKGAFDFKDPETFHALTTGLAKSISVIELAKKRLDIVKPNALVLVDRGYTPFAEFSSLCIARDIPVFTWNMAQRSGLIVMKRFKSHNTDLHHHSLSEKTWHKLIQLSWCNEYAEASERELVDSYMGGDWYGEVGTQFHVSTYDKETLLKRLSLDARKKTAIIFPHIFWDGTFFWGEDLFDNYEQWFREVLKIASQNTNLNWIIKVHPANLVKDARDRSTVEHSEITVLNDVLGSLPKHICLIEASSDVSTLSLFSIMDYCLTVRGTIGIEAAYRGIPVLTAGTGRYDRRGFTMDFNNREDYLDQLKNLENVQPLTPQENDLAKKFAFGTFVVRPIKLSSVKCSFQRDSKASLETIFTIKNYQALKRAEDVLDIANWINSKSDDYCNWKQLGMRAYAEGE